jgi:hypothetical protein
VKEATNEYEYYDEEDPEQAPVVQPAPVVEEEVKAPEVDLMNVQTVSTKEIDNAVAVEPEPAAEAEAVPETPSLKSATTPEKKSRKANIDEDKLVEFPPETTQQLFDTLKAIIKRKI